MFSRVAVAAILAAPLLAVAQSCSTGPIQCCDKVTSADSAMGSTTLALLGLVGQGITGMIGLQCSPISGAVIGQGSCTANAVCCQNNNVGGGVSIGCVPIVL
ncbi:fungal hydrophobin [Cubamyces sp. BRFM 1775]|nr:fungal hydrophobin [Cubamyces sp. BRFM 1775]